MRAAISTEGSEVAAHFGRCPEYTIVDIENGAIIRTEVKANPGHNPGAIPQFLHQQGVAVIVAGGMGMNAQQFFAEYDIQTIIGVTGGVADAAAQLAAGTLAGGASMCSPGAGKGYGVEKTVCDHDTHEDSQF